MIIISLGVWITIILLKITRLKQGFFELGLFFILTLLYGLVFFNIVEIGVINKDIIIYVGVINTLLFVDVKALVKGQKNATTFKALEKEMSALKTESEFLRQRFIGTLEVLSDGIVYLDHEKQLFLTEPAQNLLKKADPDISLENYLSEIHPDDRETVQETFSKILKTKKAFKIKYRYKVNERFLWVESHGSVIYVKKEPLIIFQLKGSDVRMFPHTDVDVLNHLPKETDCDDVLMALHQNETEYYAIAFRLTNIPGINAKYGRDVGDMMMGEFLKKMRYHFIKEDLIFRLQGILFMMVIKDLRKADILIRALKEDNALLQTTISIGGVNESVYPYFGIVHVKTFETHALDIKGLAANALALSLKETTQENFVIKEI